MRPLLSALSLIVPAAAASVAGDCQAYLDLGGAWTLANRNGTLAGLAAMVPGQVHLDLMRAGVIDDPFYRDNSDGQGWVSADGWAYTRDFEVGTTFAACTQVLAVAEGLDTLAAVVFDGRRPAWAPYTHFRNALPIDRENSTYTISPAAQPQCEEACEYDPHCVGFTMANPAQDQCWIYHAAPALYNSTDGDWFARTSPVGGAFFSRNMHRRFVWDATPALLTGAAAHNVSVSFAGTAGYEWKFLRKEADSFGWDWAPKTLTAGVWQPLYLVGVAGVAITDVVPQITAVPPNPATPLADGDNAFAAVVTVVVRLPAPATVTVAAAGSWSGPGASASTTVPLPAGESSVALRLSATDVALWWPHTHGAQALYALNVTAAAAGQPGAAATARRVGFRSVALVAHVDTRQQYYRVNGVELFVMGANWVPLDAFQGRVDAARLRDTLGSVADANMNLLRIWGGGVYNPGAFYDLCDELGIMVHQEGQFSDAVYPFDESVLEDVAAEARHQARRLAAHPSVIVWVGNNEICPSCWPPAANVTDWETLFLTHYLDVVAAEDASRPVWPLCPAYPWAGGVDPASSLPDGTPLVLSSTADTAPPWEAHFYRFDLCKTPETCGPCVDDSFYPDTTYASEFGWVGAPSLETMAPALGGAGDYTLTSAPMARHGNTFITMDAVRNSVLYNFGALAAPYVDVPSADAFRRALHLSMVAQADCVRAEVEHYRRGRDGPANTHGTMYWMLDAIWPSASWDSLEFGGRWKLLHYAAREFYDAVALDAYCSPSILNCTGLVVHAGSERWPGAVSANVTVDAVRFADGAVVAAVASWSVSLSPGRGAFFTVPSTAALLARGGCGALSDCMLLVRALDPETGAPLRPPAVRSLTLWARAALRPAANITVTVLGGGRVRVVADAVAPHVMLHAAAPGRFEPNNLLLLPGAAQEAVWLPQVGAGGLGPAEPTAVYAVAVNGYSGVVGAAAGGGSMGGE